MGEAVAKTRKVVSFSAKVKSSQSDKEPSVNDHLLQAVITASKQDEQFKQELINVLQDI